MPRTTGRSRRAFPILFGVLAVALGCAGSRRQPVPIPSQAHPRGGPRSGALIVLLPGRRDHGATGFERHGFPQLARTAGIDADLVTVDAHMGYYLSRSVVERLREDVIAPARARGYREIWLAGISLGGLGAILYAEEHPADVTGILLLAPYLGSGDPLASADDPGRRAWAALTALRRAGLPIYLGYGVTDRMAESHRLLARELPPDRVFTVPGGHQWGPWSALWRAFLGSGAIGRVGGPAG